MSRFLYFLVSIRVSFLTWMTVAGFGNRADLDLSIQKASRWPNAAGCVRSLASHFFPAAIVAWESLKNQRDSEVDPGLSGKQEKIGDITNSFKIFGCLWVCFWFDRVVFMGASDTRLMVLLTLIYLERRLGWRQEAQRFEAGAP